MEEQQQEEVKQEETIVEQAETAQPEEQTAEEKETEREINLKAENRRKQEELTRLREENERLRTHQPVSEVDNINRQLRGMNDRELESYLNNAQYSNLHVTIREILDERRFERFQAKKQDQQVRLDAEIELETNFPDVLNPAHPLSLKTKEIMRRRHLENHPQGRLIAAQLAASELGKQKAIAAGRKAEQSRQADVKANFQGESGRSAPKVSDKGKMEELKKRALQGDETARKEWMRLRISNGL